MSNKSEIQKLIEEIESNVSKDIADLEWNNFIKNDSRVNDPQSKEFFGKFDNPDLKE